MYRGRLPEIGYGIDAQSASLLEALAIAKSVAHSSRQTLDYDRQCLAEGIGNLVGGFFVACPTHRRKD